jgi:hypothetical protein
LEASWSNWCHSAAALQFHEKEVEDDEPAIIGAMTDDFMTPEVSDDKLLEHRVEEITKVDQFGGFEAVHRAEVEQGTRIFQHKWVDSREKSRITCKDLKRFAIAEDEQTHAPTPADTSNSLFDYYAAEKGYPVFAFDAVAAFLHAMEQNDKCYMELPQEWIDMVAPEHKDKIWRMLKSLYGRRTASAQFRDLFEALMCSVPDANYLRGHHEPCGYHSKEWDSLVLHHVDDGRLTGEPKRSWDLIQWLTQVLLLKVSAPITEGMAYKYLGRTKIRIKDGWITIPDHTLLLEILDLIGYTNAQLKVPDTPGTKRDGNELVYDLKGTDTTDYRSCSGKMLYYCRDIENIAYAGKELARGMHGPTTAHEKDLHRLARFPSNESKHCIEQQITRTEDGSRTLVMMCDSDCQGDDKGRSTSGFRAAINGYKLSHSSTTHPGLPAQSSGEAETRVTSKTACEGIFIQAVALEWNMPMTLEIHSDASVAVLGSQKLSGGRMKHLTAAQTLIRTLVKRRLAKVRQIGTKENIADLLTKNVDKDVYNTLGPLTGYRQLTDSEQCIVPVAMVVINKIGDLLSSEEIVAKHTALAQVLAKALALDTRGID